MLDVRGLQIDVDGHRVVEDLNLTINKGQALALIGENGAGKTTVLRALAGDIPSEYDCYTLDGEDADPANVNFPDRVFSLFDDYPWLADATIGEHFELLSRCHKGETLEPLARFGVADLADRLPFQMSSGQKRRCLLATALARPWDMLIVDEPESRLDRKTIDTVGEVFAEFLTQNRCLVIATHSPELVKHLQCHTLDLEQGSA